MFDYCLVCSLMGEDRQVVRQGARLAAEIAQRHSLPVTWALDARSARSYAGLLTSCHAANGDDLLLMLDVTPLLASKETLQSLRDLAQDRVRMREEFPPFIEAERDRLTRVLDWAEPTVAGAVVKNEALAPALEQVGFRGLWGYGWEQAEPEGVQDRGCPFGYFMISRERHNGPGPERTSVVGIPYASIDLPGIAVGHVPYDVSAELAYALPRGAARLPLDLLLANREWNAHLACVQHLTAELLVTGETDSLTGLLDEHLAYVKALDGVRTTTLAESVTAYHDTPADQRWVGILSQVGSRERGTDEGETASSLLFYYDDECQLRLEEGALIPQTLRNYTSPPFESRYCAELATPELIRGGPVRLRDRLMFEFEFDSPKAMPYALGIWGDYSLLRLDSTDADAVHWIGKHLLLVRAGLQIGPTIVRVTLGI